MARRFPCGGAEPRTTLKAPCGSIISLGEGAFGDSWIREDNAIQVRGVAMLPGERISHVFSPELGLTEQPPETGQVLVATNQRVLAFCQNDGHNETFLVPVEELGSVAVKTRRRRSGSIIQGMLLTVAGVLLYLALAYWLTGRFDGPAVPVIGMDMAPFLLLLTALFVVAWSWGRLFAKSDGSVIFQGANWSFTFPYRGDRAGRHVYQVVNGLFATRWSRNSPSYLWED